MISLPIAGWILYQRGILPWVALFGPAHQNPLIDLSASLCSNLGHESARLWIAPVNCTSEFWTRFLPLYYFPGQQEISPIFLKILTSSFHTSFNVIECTYVRRQRSSSSMWPFKIVNLSEYRWYIADFGNLLTVTKTIVTCRLRLGII